MFSFWSNHFRKKKHPQTEPDTTENTRRLEAKLMKAASAMDKNPESWQRILVPVYEEISEANVYTLVKKHEPSQVAFFYMPTPSGEMPSAFIFTNPEEIEGFERDYLHTEMPFSKVAEQCVRHRIESIVVNPTNQKMALPVMLSDLLHWVSENLAALRDKSTHPKANAAMAEEVAWTLMPPTQGPYPADLLEPFVVIFRQFPGVITRAYVSPVSQDQTQWDIALLLSYGDAQSVVFHEYMEPLLMEAMKQVFGDVKAFQAMRILSLNATPGLEGQLQYLGIRPFFP
jgi:hypothetical protein